MKLEVTNSVICHRLEVDDYNSVYTLWSKRSWECTGKAVANLLLSIVIVRPPSWNSLQCCRTDRTTSCVIGCRIRSHDSRRLADDVRVMWPPCSLCRTLNLAGVYKIQHHVSHSRHLMSAQCDGQKSWMAMLITGLHGMSVTAIFRAPDVWQNSSQCQHLSEFSISSPVARNQ